MKKILCCILIFFGLIGCANQAQEIYMSTTSAIYIDENLVGKKVYVNFNENEGNLTEVVKFELIKNGYIITQEELSDINIKGCINFFRKNSFSRPTMLMDMGFGFGRLIGAEALAFYTLLILLMTIFTIKSIIMMPKFHYL